MERKGRINGLDKISEVKKEVPPPNDPSETE